MGKAILKSKTGKSDDSANFFGTNRHIGCRIRQRGYWLVLERKDRHGNYGQKNAEMMESASNDQIDFSQFSL